MTFTLTAITDQTDIRKFQAIARRSALKLEAVGMKRRGPSVLSVIKRETGLKASTAKRMLPLYEQWLQDQGYVEL
jgi:hypothetical protein